MSSLLQDYSSGPTRSYSSHFQKKVDPLVYREDQLNVISQKLSQIPIEEQLSGILIMKQENKSMPEVGIQGSEEVKTNPDIAPPKKEEKTIVNKEPIQKSKKEITSAAKITEDDLNSLLDDLGI